MLIYLQAIESERDKLRFEELYLTYRGLMFYVANQILKNEQDAEDAVHLAFVSLAERVDSVPNNLGPQTRALVVTVAERKAIDLYRAKRRHPLIDIDELPLSYGENEIELNGTLANAMAALAPRYREVLLLRYYNGYRDREIAGFLGISPANVRQIAARAKKKLAEMLAEQGVSV